MSREKDQTVVPFERKPKTITSRNGVPVTYGPLNPPPRAVALMTTRRLIEELESMDFWCAGGPLDGSMAWNELRRRLGYPAPARPQQTTDDPA